MPYGITIYITKSVCLKLKILVSAVTIGFYFSGNIPTGPVVVLGYLFGGAKPLVLEKERINLISSKNVVACIIGWNHMWQKINKNLRNFELIGQIIVLNWPSRAINLFVRHCGRYYYNNLHVQTFFLYILVNKIILYGPQQSIIPWKYIYVIS